MKKLKSTLLSLFTTGFLLLTVHDSFAIFTLRMDTANGYNGDQVVINITTADFIDLISFQGTVQFNQAVISFNSIENMNAPSMDISDFGLGQVNLGVVTFNWSDPTFSGQDMSNGDIVWSIRFDVIGNPGQGSLMQFTGLPTAMDAKDISFSTIPFNFINGLVSVIACPMPSVPSSANTVKIKQNSAKLDYGAASNADKYRIRWREKAGPGPWNFRHKSAALPTHIYVTTLDPNTTYQWQVKALNCNDDSISGFTPVEEFTTLSGDCLTPSGLNETNVVYDGATLNWGQSLTNDGYRVRWKKTAGGTWKYRNLGVNGNNTSVSYLMSNTMYDWQAKTKCPSGTYTGWSAISQFTTSANNCNAPTNLWTKMDGQNCIDLYWDAPGHTVNRYKIQYRDTAGGSWKHRTVHDSLATVFNVCNIMPSTTYEWFIKSECPTGQNSVPSAYDIFTTPAFKTQADEGSLSGTSVDRFRVYPNPVRDQLFLSANLGQEQLMITNILGEQVDALINLNTGANSIDVSALQNGVYFLSVIGSEEPYTVRFVKVN